MDNVMDFGVKKMTFKLKKKFIIKIEKNEINYCDSYKDIHFHMYNIL